MDYMVSKVNREEYTVVEKYKQICRELIYKQDYESLNIILDEFEYFITKYSMIPDYKCLIKFIEWHRGILFHKYYDKPQKAELCFKKIYDPKLKTQLDINICNSLGLITIELYGCEAALGYFQNAYSAFESIPYTNDVTLFPRLGYNLSYCLFDTGQINIAIDMAFKVLEYIERNHLLYLYGKILHMIGIMYEEQGRFIEALKYVEHAYYLFTIEGKKNYIKKAGMDMQRIINKANK